MLAKNAMAPRLFRVNALSLATFASKLAPTTSFNAVRFEAVCQRFLSVTCYCWPATSSFSAGCCWYCR
ncbi:hypothetical protein C1Y18_32440 [Pseudomonas sp. MPR-R5A]|nr:hypothetical protein C1Y25_26815 [Pseudomonas sp. MPBC4-3]PMX10255.1 hypothetical protein C1Y23_33585 [Pseudomonas sp. GW460-12]PMX31175.1 hypothetical protein C1Y26_33715 [Pseudomonas sp. MPR-R2A7]PMX37480.1 hypothetical protein C1Y24_01845 [Pseudomonas sp. MPR-R2A4]PMX44864.1 hypothetical protein C1Y20_23300 [Pseudomonas sp. FW301-21B01]PMX45679.1 hypothetical protein C1Y17_34080 [Pseudomonas sp. MPR-R2A6]PMX80353.1 hypothetical protein C1Y21_33500 [Pseudomonas sp. MPR-R2A3]PMY01941.1 h